MTPKELAIQAATNASLPSPERVPVHCTTDRAMADVLEISKQAFYGMKQTYGASFPTKNKKGWLVAEVINYLAPTGRISEKHSQGGTTRDTPKALNWWHDRARHMWCSDPGNELELARHMDQTLTARDTHRAWCRAAFCYDIAQWNEHGTLSRELVGLTEKEIKLILGERHRKNSERVRELYGYDNWEDDEE